MSLSIGIYEHWYVPASSFNQHSPVCDIPDSINLTDQRTSKMIIAPRRYFSRTPQSRGRVLSAVTLAPPNPNCFVCKERSELYLEVDVNTATVCSV